MKLASVDERVQTPRSWQQLSDRYPAIVTAYDDLSDACRDNGPLEASAVALVALPTIGLPAALDALGWIDESIREAGAD